MRDVEEIALAFDKACEAAGVQYAFIGGMAVFAWGQPRMTADVDALLLLDAEQDQVHTLVRQLANQGLNANPVGFMQAFRDASHVSVFDEDSPFHVDVKLARTPAEREEVKAAVEVPHAGGRLRVAPAEDTVAFKLKFASPQDLQDARSILARQAGRLDMARLTQVVKRLGVQDALERELAALEEAENLD